MRLTARERAHKKEKKLARQERVAIRQTAREERPPEVRISPYVKFEFHECLVPENLFNGGMGSVWVTRRLRYDRLVTGVFLLDIWCMGVKNAFIRRVGVAEYEHYLAKTADVDGPLRQVTPEFACKLVCDAVEYAAGLGLAPHRDYAAAREIFAGVDPSLCEEEFTFGKDGRPLYVQGPYDDPERIFSHLALEAPGKDIALEGGT